MSNHAGEALHQIRTRLAEFVTREQELAKAELGPAVKHARAGAGLLGAAGAFAFHALWMLVISLALALGWLLDTVTPLSTWGAFTLGFLAMAVLSGLIAAGLGLFGIRQAKQVKAPTATIEEARTTLGAVLDAATGRDLVQVELAARDDVPIHPRRSA